MPGLGVGMGTGLSTGTSSTAVEALHHVERLGRYRIVARLGQGGMGTIHLAVAFGLADFRKLLVVKELRPELTSNDRFVEMFLAEAKLAARLDHPNIVQTLEAGQDGERYYLAMEFLDGQPLVEILKRVDATQAIPTSLLIQILCEVLGGLHYAHELCDYDETPLHIVHRDVNPQNVFVTYHGHVKLVDFGIAKVIDSEMCTTAGVFKGKFPYAAPEQVNCQTVDRRADVFAVGVMLWEILAQRRFAPGQPTTEAIDARLAGAEPRISAVRPDIDPELAAICDHAMEVDPALRYPTAEEFRIDLLDFLASRTGMATPLSLAELMRREFAAERTAAHRVISSQIRKVMPDEDLGDSLVRVLTRSHTSPGVSSADVAVAHGPTHDASKLDTSPARPIGARRSEGTLVPAPTELKTVADLRPGARRVRAISVSVIALGAFVAAYFLVRAEMEPKHLGSQNATQSLVRPAPPGPARTAGTEHKTEHQEGEPPALLAAEPLPAKEPAPAAEPPKSTLSGASRTSQHLSNTVTADLARPRHGASARVRRAGPSPQELVEPETAAESLDLVGPSPQAERGAAKTQAKVRPKPSRTPSFDVGDDLRVLRRQRKPRPLSLEDPF